MTLNRGGAVHMSLATCRALDRVRQYVGRTLGEVNESATALLWVTDFPMFEWCAQSRSCCHVCISPATHQVLCGESAVGGRLLMFHGVRSPCKSVKNHVCCEY